MVINIVELPESRQQISNYCSFQKRDEQVFERKYVVKI